MLRNVDW